MTNFNISLRTKGNGSGGGGGEEFKLNPKKFKKFRFDFFISNSLKKK